MKTRILKLVFSFLEGGNKMEISQNKERSFLEAVTPYLFLILTIILAQQIINIFFVEENTTRVIAKLILDTMLIAVGLGISHKLVGEAILYAGLIRFVLIFFQLQGMDPVMRVVALIFTVLVLFVVGFIKFGKSLQNK